jgi:TolB-like protein/class 3 adenylate cyclase
VVSEIGERKLAAILVSDIVGYSRLASANEDLTLARLRALRSDLIDPLIATHRGRIVKRTGDGALVEFRSVVDAVRCAIEVQNGIIERNVGVPPERRIEFRIGIHLGDVVEESDGDLMGDGVNIAARLEGICPPNGVCLSEDAYRQVRSRLDLAVTDLGDQTLKNIAEPVRVYTLDVGKPAQARPAAAVATMPEKAGPPRLSMVVLPFANIGGDPEQEYFVDGVTESLTTDLSRISGSFVIARNTAFTYKGKPVDVKQIGRELNIRYVLEGSVQRGGNRLRVNVQLIDAETGNHLWAERFDKPVADLFDMQDEIVARLARQLATELVAAEARRAEKTANPDAMDLYFQGMAWANQGTSPEYHRRADDLVERALALDPTNVEVLVGKARVAYETAAASLTDDPGSYLAAAEAAATKALALAPKHAWAHFWLGMTYTKSNRSALAIAEFDRALALDPNLAHGHAATGMAKMSLGHADETEGHVRDALRLSPGDSSTYVWELYAGAANLVLADDAAAVLWLRRSIESNGNLPITHFYLAAALAQLGRLEEARSAARSGLMLDPSFTIRRLKVTTGTSFDNPTYLAQVERLYDCARIAGVPEG